MPPVSEWAAQFVEDDEATIDAEPIAINGKSVYAVPRPAVVPWGYIACTIACFALGFLQPLFFLAAGCFALTLAARR
jgi:hypothetical protein